MAGNIIQKKILVSAFYRIDKILAQIESGILVIIVLCMILIAFFQVILRNFFNIGIIWGDTLLRYFVLWIGFLGASLATRENRHIKIDALSRILKPDWQRRFNLVTNLFSTVICFLLAKAAYVFIQDERAFGTALFLGIPTWLFLCIILIGFIIITFRFFLKLFLPLDKNQLVSAGE
jgi:TRAP-type C4-dicarboxylate transport system permease small subunit